MQLADNDCGLSNGTIAIGQWMTIVTYTVMLPVYILVGLPTNLILLVTFYKQSKKEHTYCYQVLLTISKTLEIFVYGGFILCLTRLSGQTNHSVTWFNQSFVLMWINFKMGLAAHMHLITSSIMLSTATAADRVFALAFPLRYTKIDHKKHQMIAGLTCFVLPATSSVAYVFLGKIEKVGDHYEAPLDEEFMASTFGRMCSRIGLFMRVTCVASLVALNVVMVICFRKRFIRIALMNDQEKKEVRKAANKTLFLLNFWQSVLMVINQSPLAALHAMAFIDPTFLRCHWPIAGPISTTFIFITDSIDLLVVVAINGKMRSAVRSAVGCGQQQA